MGAACARSARAADDSPPSLLSSELPARLSDVAPTIRLSWRTLVIYNLPLVATNCVALLIAVFAMKFATDTLFISPGAMGTIFSVSRLWDSVTDPFIGHLSDRTTLVFGRRRSWMAAGALPLAASLVIAFSPPVGLSASALVYWEGVAVVLFFTFSAVIEVPHLSLGAELTQGLPPPERNRLFGYRYAATVLGLVAATVFMYFLTKAQAQGRQYIRPLAASVSVGVGACLVVLVLVSAIKLREPRPPMPEAGAQAGGGGGCLSPFRSLAGTHPHPGGRVAIQHSRTTTHEHFTRAIHTRCPLLPSIPASILASILAPIPLPSRFHPASIPLVLFASVCRRALQPARAASLSSLLCRRRRQGRLHADGPLLHAGARPAYCHSLLLMALYYMQARAPLTATNYH